MAILKVTAQTGTSTQSAELNSTKVKVVSNVSVYYATGIDPVAYSANASVLPANTIRDIIVGPGQEIYVDNNIIGNTRIGGTGPKIAFRGVSSVAEVTITEVGYVNFDRVDN